VCDICGQGFAGRGTLKTHLNVHGGPKKGHGCSLCEAAYTFRSDLMKHMRAKHNGKTKLPKAHLETPRRSTKSVPCPTCGRTLNYKSSLSYHMRTHTGERPYVCDICGQGFAGRGTLKTHLNVHGGPKYGHGCSLCEAAYTFRCDLTKHMRAKHGGTTN